jgi:excisionase family DNA binding protein
MIPSHDIKARMTKTKREAADFLGVKPRTLELYTQQGRLSVKYGKGQRGRVAQYDETELETLKHDLEQEAETAYPHRGALIAKPHAGIATGSDSEQILKLLSAALSSRQDGPPVVPIAEKLMLTIAEAAALAGLSRVELRAAIKEKKLQAIRRRGFKIKRADLDSFIKNL